TPVPEPFGSTFTPHLKDLKLSLEFISMLQDANLNDSGLDTDVLHQLKNPPQYPLDLSDKDLLHSIDLFFATVNASEQTYEDARAAAIRREPNHKVLSYAAVHRKMAELSGIVPHIEHQCEGSCIAYTSDLQGPASGRALSRPSRAGL
ncbi:uncharacterized protein TRAVEDRAFT_133072, partial [Trametes versicolor FP-101664 SS1]|uniref:uncharacterized protein n=1 Tax=Trametes versicolor (strain FP-101664) TaxID=717944 RepID=UPI0004623531